LIFADISKKRVKCRIDSKSYGMKCAGLSA
jgi:hypothetical protein